jgi:hypothetical protein
MRTTPYRGDLEFNVPVKSNDRTLGHVRTFLATIFYASSPSRKIVSTG